MPKMTIRANQSFVSLWPNRIHTINPLLSTSVTRVTRFEIVASAPRIINARNLPHVLCLSVVELRQGRLFFETEESLQAVRAV